MFVRISRRSVVRLIHPGLEMQTFEKLISPIEYDCLLPFAVMTFLFGGQRSFLEKARVVAKLAAEHATNLAAFAGLYKVGKTYCSR